MQRFRIALTALAFFVPAVAWAQENPAPKRQVNLLLQQRFLQFMVLDGRLAVSAVSDSQGAIGLGNVRQHFTISLTQNGTVLDFDLTSPSEKLFVHIEGDDQATLRRQYAKSEDAKPNDPASASQPQTIVEYTQAPQQPVKLTVTENGETREVEADSLWQLLMFEPELSGRYLVPILEMLRPGWQLLPATEELKQFLLHSAGAHQAANRPRWAALVAQLTDEHYAVRQRAERQLRAAGKAALPYLQSLQRNDLDAEQWRRISEIISVSVDDREDTPQRISTRLMDDRSVWLGFLADPQESTRRIAADRLSTIVGAKVAFDPAASPEARSTQLAALRAKLLSKK